MIVNINEAGTWTPSAEALELERQYWQALDLIAESEALGVMQAEDDEEYDAERRADRAELEELTHDYWRMVS